MKIEEYLQILPNYTFPDRIILAAMGRYGIAEGEEAFQPDRGSEWERKRDLAEACMWESAAGILNGGGNKRQIGNTSYTEMSITSSKEDRQMWMEKARALRAKWGENVPSVGKGIFNAGKYWA